MNENYDVLDLSKFILSIFVVAIHCGLFPNILFPWLRLAVPLFFVISSFLLYLKIQEDQNNKWKIIKKSVCRQLKLYFVWFIILLPLTLYLKRDWFERGWFNALLLFVRGFFFQSTFRGSWFISANIISMVIIAYLSDHFSNRTVFAFSVLVYLFCCFASSYLFLINGIVFLEKSYSFYERIFGAPYQSFPVALVWHSTGKIISENRGKITKTNYYLMFIFALFLYLEWFIVMKHTAIVNNDCYILLLPLTISIFCRLINIKRTIKYSIYLRNSSTMVYLLHGSIRPFFSHFTRRISEPMNGLVTFVLVLIASYSFCYIVFKNKDKHEWMKNLY